SKGLFGENVAFQVVSPSEPTAEAMGRQRFEFSRKVESGEIEALIEVGPLVLEGRASSAAGSSDVKDDTAVIRYQTRSAAGQRFRMKVELRRTGPLVSRN